METADKAEVFDCTGMQRPPQAEEMRKTEGLTNLVFSVEIPDRAFYEGFFIKSVQKKCPNNPKSATKIVVRSRATFG